MKTSKTGSSIWKPSLILVILLASVIAYAGISQSQGGSGGQMSLTDGLVLHWTFDGAHMDWSNTGAEVRDISGSGNHGSLEGTLGQGSVARGIMGQALDFSASNSDRIQTSANNDDLVGQDITITAWIKPRSTSVRQQIVTQDGESYDCRRFFFEVNASNQVAFGVYTANESSGNPVLGTVVADRWQFVAARLTDGSEKKIWLDDDSTTSTTGSLTIQYHGNTDPIQVSGRLRNGGENFFDGLIDDVRIYTRALSDDEIQQIKRVGERTLAANSPANALTDGLVAHWTFDGPDMDWGNTGQEVRDLSGNNNHGSLEGSLGQSSVARGALGQSLKFDGATAYVDMGVVSDFDFGTGDFTFSTWVKTGQDCSGDKAYIGKYHSNVSTSIAIACTNDGGQGKAYFTVRGSDNLYSDSGLSTTVINNDSWYLLTGVKEGNFVKIYINDELENSDSAEYTGNFNSGTFQIGRYNVSPWYYADATLDDVRIYNRALSGAEIQQLFELGKKRITPNTSATGALTNGLIGHWTFDGPDMEWGNTGQEVRDLSGNNNHGSLEGSLGQSSVARGNVGQALYFNGTSDYVNIGDVETLRFGTGDFTFATWVKTEQDCTGNKVHLGKYHNISNSVSVWLGCTDDGGDGKASFNIRDSDGGDSLRSGVSTTVVNDGGWYFITGVKEGNTVKIYVNGTLENSGSRVLTGNVNAGDVYIGAYNDLGHHSDATLDDVRIYNRALSGAEIQQLFELGKKRITPNTSATGALTDGLVAHWTFDGADIEWGERRRGGS